MIGAAVIAVLATAGLTSCGSSDTGSKSLTWYANPDGGGSDPKGGGQVQLAAECSAESGGKYSIDVHQLPNGASDQRTQLLRRLAAGDSTMDIMSLDPVFVAEFAEAGFLAPIPKGDAAEFTKNVVDGAKKSSTWKGQLVAAPFWANTQLLWYRKSVAKKAGLDMSKPVTWKQIIDAAEKEKKTIGVQASLYEGYTVWINALVEGAGGEILKNPGAKAKNIKLGIDSKAGTEAASVIDSIATKGLAGPAMSSTDETAALDLFQSPATSGFLVNWPYVWSAFAANKVEFIDDIGWTKYPRTVAGEKSAPPLGGINLAVGGASHNPDLAYEAIKCIRSPQKQKTYMLGTGNPASVSTVFDDPAIKKQFPMAGLIRTSLEDSAPRPQSPFYGEISTGLQTAFSPPSSVVPSSTPEQAASLISAVVKGNKLL